jgi:hypothetical protein
MGQQSDAGQAQRSFEAVAWRDIAPSLPMVFVFPAWDGDELVKVNDVDTARRYYGVSAELWERIRSAYALETGKRIEDSGIQVQLQPPGHTRVDVAIPVVPFRRQVSLAGGTDQPALLRTVELRTIRIERPE